MKTVVCPQCQRRLEIPDDAKEGDITDCPF